MSGIAEVINSMTILKGDDVEKGVELKLFSTQIETWGSPLLIRAYDENDAEELTRILFKIPSDIGITARIRQVIGD